jgi:hypothetical protein
VCPFSAEARNLETIAPPWLKFEVLTLVLRRGGKMRHGLGLGGARTALGAAGWVFQPVREWRARQLRIPLSDSGRC